MKPIVVLGMAQPYPGYGCEQVTIVANRIPDTIVAFGQTRHSIIAKPTAMLSPKPTLKYRPNRAVL
jgi:hypothetical protein